MKELKFTVTGMTCAACQANVEKTAKRIEGVSNAQVNLLTEELTVYADEENKLEEKIIEAVNSIGYGAKMKNDSDKNTLKAQWDERAKREEEKERRMKKRLFSSIILLTILMYIAMGHMIGLPLPELLQSNVNPLLNAAIQMLLALPVLIINRKFFISGFKGLIKKVPNMDSLVALGSGASFIYGVFVIILIIISTGNGDTESLHRYAHQLYFESSAMILTLVTVGKYLEARSKRKTGDALGKLIDLSPKTANIIKNGKEITIPAEDVQSGDILIIRPGERIAVDGTVESGVGYVDQASITGESLPVEKKPGDEIISATLNKNGTFKMTATRVGENTTISQIIRLVDKASSDKAPIARLADKVSAVFVPVVMGIAFVTFIVWLISGAGAENALSFGITVLVISCPCALGLATPVAIMAGTGKAAENGILIKNASALETLCSVDEIYLDKTGTITTGEMTVSDIYAVNNCFSQEEFLNIAASLEAGSEHPLAKAVRKKAQGLQLVDVKDFRIYEGRGISGYINNKLHFAGNELFIKEQGFNTSPIFEKISEFTNQGKTALIFAAENEFIGIIAVSDTVREDSKIAIDALNKLGKTVKIITGDNKNAANHIAKEAGIYDPNAQNVYSDLLPGSKDEYIRLSQEQGKKVAFIGDGINDAPALTRADVGIAIGAGTDIAIDSADIVLIKSSILDAAKAVELSKSVVKNIKMNLFWAFFYNALGIPLAAGVFYPLLGLRLTPMIGSAAMSLSSLCVVTNALRLRYFKSKFIYNKKSESQITPETTNRTEVKSTMTKTFKIEGMMCPRCEAHVVKAIKAIDGVEDAAASHTEGTATVTFSKEVADGIIKAAVTEEGYEFLG